jgi:hypothetical protein
MNTGFPFTPPTATPPRDVFVVPPGSRVFTRTHVRPPIGFGGGSYYYGPQPMPETAAPQAPAAANGLLRLSSTPASGQVFVDGYYVGTLADVDAQRALTLPAGPHRVEIRAPGYEPATFDVRIDPTDTVTYRAAPERIPAPPARAAAPAAATRMYVIPNCYLGNVPPRADRLPKGCDIKRVRVIS